MEPSDSTHSWQFWPVMCLAFLYPVNIALIGVSIPIYYFTKGVSIVIIGFLASALAITYSFSPILLNKHSQKFGKKKSILIATLGATGAQMSFYFTLEPAVFFIARLMEGFVMGFFWANLQSTISDSLKDKQSKYAASYNLSWNLGVLNGFLLGAIILFFIDDVEIIFFLAPLILILASFIALIFFQESPNINSQTSSYDKYDMMIEESDSQDKNEFSKYSIPITVPLLLGACYCISRSSISLLYPIKSEILGLETYTIYAFFFFMFLGQTLFTVISSHLTMKSLKMMTLISLGGVIIIIIILGMVIAFNVFLYIFLFLLIGSCNGLLIGTTVKLFVALNVKYQTSKYSSIHASLIGISLLITPIFVGFIAAIDLTLGFYSVSIAILISLVPTVIFISKIHKEKLIFR